MLVHASSYSKFSGRVCLHSCLDHIQWVPNCDWGSVLMVWYPEKTRSLDATCDSREMSVHDQNLFVRGGRVSHCILKHCNDTGIRGDPCLMSLDCRTYLRHTSHRTGSELVDKGQRSLCLVGHDGDVTWRADGLAIVKVMKDVQSETPTQTGRRK